MVGYSVPHPSEPVLNIRIQTKEEAKITNPVVALQQGLQDLSEVCDHILETFDKELQEFSSKK